MKKYFSGCFVLALFLMCFTFSVSAANGVSELPGVKIIIDGQMGTYKSAPVSINNRTLLPLKEILVNLGVKDDSDHIKWNASERSVTIVKDSTKVYLKIGSDKASVNDEEVVLDAAPVVYKDKTYIPVKFVAQSFGKKVVWDEASKSVIIRDEESYNHIKDIMTKSNTAMEQIKNCKMDADASVKVGQGSASYDINMKMNGIIDMLKKNLYINTKMDMSVMKMDVDMYMADGVFYMKNPLTAEWQKKTIDKSEYDKMFQQSSTTSIYDATDVFCAGLQEVKSDNPNEIVLKGDIFIGDLLKLAGQTTASAASVEYDKFNIQISMDKSTYTINSMTMNLVFHITGASPTNATALIKCNFTDYNGSNTVTVPADVIKNAVENTQLNLGVTK